MGVGVYYLCTGKEAKKVGEDFLLKKQVVCSNEEKTKEHKIW